MCHVCNPPIKTFVAVANFNLVKIYICIFAHRTLLGELIFDLDRTVQSLIYMRLELNGLTNFLNYMGTRHKIELRINLCNCH